MGIVSEVWRWRSQVWHLAKMDLVKTCRGAVLGWIWLFVKPVIYISVFWFALAFGLKAGAGSGDCPYIVWLACGLIPWFFMQDMVNTGSNVYKRYSYLVNKIRFPLPAISAFYVLSKFLVYAASFAVLLLGCFLFGVHVGLEIVQIPVLALFMYVFFAAWSMAVSPFSAVSKDFANLIKTLSMPLFWVSGIIYDVSQLGIGWIQTALAFNPVTFFVEAHRSALVSGQWLWERPDLLAPFALVFVLTLAAAVLCQRRARQEVTDVL